MPAPKEGGIKGFLTRAGASFYAGGLLVKEQGWVWAKKAGNVGFMVATTSIVVLMPLIFEIMREGQVSDMYHISVMMSVNAFSLLMSCFQRITSDD
jgi:Ca2+/H+ antiporter